MLAEPSVHIETEVLFAPEHSSPGLPHHARFFLSSTFRGNCSVEIVRFPAAGPHDVGKTRPERLDHGRRGLVA